MTSGLLVSPGGVRHQPIYQEPAHTLRQHAEPPRTRTRAVQAHPHPRSRVTHSSRSLQRSHTQLKLLPSPRRNPDGRRAISIAMLGDRHREWADKLGPLRSRDGAEFDASRIVPYAYRHTYVISPGCNRL